MKCICGETLVARPKMEHRSKGGKASKPVVAVPRRRWFCPACKRVWARDPS